MKTLHTIQSKINNKTYLIIGLIVLAIIFYIPLLNLLAFMFNEMLYACYMLAGWVDKLIFGVQFHG